ncbi:2Fe-2S iron-sulfur cluster-binding protein [Pseudomonas entomophila]|uniref:2Fe-2S iron-sulfur cluster-binding protein n=1 Tax=Pseudomonas entomophila TaxID=312306 RepID=UPI0023D87B82|nr:2Fe-2S iron-sulfur cluster-binding protein [Pseudomonas entomophila]MDF0731495.1 2Fe-2S iron-sulfur cluster-binding protein [Pseudomonas entomophila]
MSGLRLPGASGAPLGFCWNGRRMTALAGDSVAQALLANGVRTLAWTRKAHRPMGLSGLYTTGVLARVDGVPNVRLDQCLVREGMQVQMQNCWPSPRFDLLRLARLVPSRWLRGGFEQTNLVPSGGRLFQHWEALLAFLAGVAAPASRGHDGPPPVGQRLRAEVLVIGAGPTGCAAANRAAEAGREVLLVSRGAAQARLAVQSGARLPRLDERVRCAFGLDVFGAYREGRLLLAAPSDPSLPAVALEADEVILATGRRVVPTLVPGAWLPGVMDARTALALASERRIAPGKAVVVVGDGLYKALANRLRQLGVHVVAVADVRDLRRVYGRRRVTGVLLDRLQRCDALVFDGPGLFDDSLSFQGAASGRLQLRGGSSAYRRAGSAAEADPELPPPTDGDVLLCPCFDVCGHEVDDLLAQGIDDLEVIKRLTSCGMGPCQGQPCWDSLRAYVAARLGLPAGHLAKPTLRPPRRALTVAQAAGLADVVEPLR